MAPLEGKTANTPRLGPVSTSRQRIAELARQALGMAVAIAWLPGPAGTRRRVAKLSVEEPDAAEPARPDLWGARVSNDPGLPDPDEALRNYIQAAEHDPDYREALDRIAVWHHAQGRLFPVPLVDWAIRLHLGQRPTPPQPRGDQGRPAYAQANRNFAMAEVFHLLGYLGLHEKLVRYNVIGAEFGCSEDAVRKALKTHAQWTGQLPRPWECWPAPRRTGPFPR